MSLCFRPFAKALSFLDYDLKKKSASKLYIESALPGTVLDVIRTIKITRGWLWKGEYMSFPENPQTFEILMYTSRGEKRVVQVDRMGNVFFIYLNGSNKFYVL